MKQGTAGIAIVLISLLGIIAMNSAYIVDQTQQVVVTQFGEPMGGPITDPGLHWKTPFIQEANKFEKRILEWDGYPSEVPTKDKKFIWVDVTGRWRITDPLKFFQTMRNERSAQSRLDDIMDGVTRNFITRYNLTELVRSTNRIIEGGALSEDFNKVEDTEYENITVGRDEITRKILEEARKSVNDFGIQIIDLRIKRINYIESVQQKVFDRMISERKRAAEELRSEGAGVKAEIDGRREKELKRIQSEAYAKAQKVKGEADAQVTQIYGEAYGKDPEFYGFMNTLEKYPAALSEGRLILTTDSEFFRYLKEIEKK